VIPGFPTGANRYIKNENRFPTEKNISLHLEFNADSKYVILSEKYLGQ
jgi:hypothetical protein